MPRRVLPRSHQARDQLLDLFVGPALRSLAQEAGIANEHHMNITELRIRVIDRWPHSEVTKRVAALLALAERDD